MSEEQNLQEKDNKSECKKKLMLVLTLLSFIFSIAAFTLSIVTYNTLVTLSGQTSRVVISKKYDKGKSFEKAQKLDKPILVFFYTDWCGYCQRFAPTFHKITKNSNVKENFAVAYVNCEKEENLPYIHEYDVKGFPTVYVIDENGGKTLIENDILFAKDAEEAVVKKLMKIVTKEADE